LTDGDVDMSDIKTMVFEIFSSRKKFTYDFRERLTLYFGFIGPVLKCLRCKCFNHERMNHVNKVF